MKRTVAVFSLLLAACGGERKAPPPAVAAGPAPTPTLTQSVDDAARIQADEKWRADEEAFYAKTPAGKIWVKHRDWSRSVCWSIARHEITVGMTSEQVRAAWGKPNHINSTITANRRHEQWVYDSGSYVYFEGGIMTSLQTTSSSP